MLNSRRVGRSLYAMVLMMTVPAASCGTVPAPRPQIARQVILEPAPPPNLDAEDLLNLTLPSPTMVLEIDAVRLRSDPLLRSLLEGLMADREGAGDDTNEADLGAFGSPQGLLQVLEQCEHALMSVDGARRLPAPDGPQPDVGTRRRRARYPFLFAMRCSSEDWISSMNPSGVEPEVVGEDRQGRAIRRYSESMEVYFNGGSTWLLGSVGSVAELLRQFEGHGISRAPFVVDGFPAEPRADTAVRFAFEDRRANGLAAGAAGFRFRLNPGSVVNGTVSLGAAGLGLDARAMWETSRPAEESLGRLEALRAALANNIFMLISGLAPVIESAELRREGSSMFVRLMVPRATLEAIWSLVSAQVAAERGLESPPITPDPVP